MSNKQKIEFLESLVWNRYSENDLNKKLSDFFGQEITVYNATQGRIDSGEDPDELSDWNLMFTVESKDEDIDQLDADIYMLPTRELDEENKPIMYITEVGYEFW